LEKEDMKFDSNSIHKRVQKVSALHGTKEISFLGNSVYEKFKLLGDEELYNWDKFHFTVRYI
jgi:hypothetical protein